MPSNNIVITVDGSEYTFDVGKMMLQEAIALKKFTGLTPESLSAELQKGDPTAVGALVWLAKRRAGEAVKFSELDFDLGSLSIADPDAAEKAEAAEDPTEPADEPESSAT